MKFFIANSFSSVEFNGQPVAVILPQRKSFISDDIMQRTAAEVGYTATVFAIPSSEKVPRGYEAVWEARFFSTTEEIKYCSRSVVALMQCMMDGGLAKPGKKYKMVTKDGKINVYIDAGIIMIESQDIESHFVLDSRYDIKELSEGLGIDYNECLNALESTGYGDLPVEINGGEKNSIIVPVGSLEQLVAAKPDSDVLLRLCEKFEVDSIFLFTLEKDHERDPSVFYVHARCFASDGTKINERISGDNAGQLAYYLAKHNIIRDDMTKDREGFIKFTCIQGDADNRLSKVYCGVQFRGIPYVDGEPNVMIRIGGRGVVLVDGRIDLTNRM